MKKINKTDQNELALLLPRHENIFHFRILLLNSEKEKVEEKNSNKNTTRLNIDRPFSEKNWQAHGKVARILDRNNMNANV